MALANRFCNRITLWTGMILGLCLWGKAAGQQIEPSLIKDMGWRNIGNANLKGRISSLDALHDDWTHVLVGTASGGVFKSDNGGMTWDAIFDIYGTDSIGDAKFFQGDPKIIWVGTGEEDGRNTATWGDGIYKSTDGGRTFKNMGLRDTYTIGCVLPHPKDPNIVYACALGCIWGPIGDRGFFKSTDGGQTWQKLTNGLPTDDKRSGALYAVMDPTDPNTIYVSFWPRDRKPWQLTSGGPNGGIFKSTDGGQSFRKLTKGLPEGDSGKIGLAISESNPKVIMAHYEHGFQPAQGTPDYNDMTKLGSGIYRSEDGGETWQYMNRNFSRPFYYNHLAISPLDDKLTYHFNQNFQMSSDGGKTLRAPGAIAAGGAAPARGGRGAAAAAAGGNLGGGHCWHAVWLDPHNKNRFYTGSDGGVNLTQDGGQNWVQFKNLNATQYYFIAADMRDPYWVYGGLQDAGTSGGPSMTRSQGIYMNEWKNIQGGDGFHVQVDPTDWRTVYTDQDPKGFGAEVSRTNMVTRERLDIRPWKGRNILNYYDYITSDTEKMQADKGWSPIPPFSALASGEAQDRESGSGAFRYNWATPISLSPQNPHTVYVGTNHLFRSTDRGDNWSIISPDLSKNDPVQTRKGSGGMTPDEKPGGGAEYYGTIVTMNESPNQAGVLWAGTDDGNVQVSRDNGKSWKNVATNIKDLPSQNFYVTRVRPSRYSAATCYVTIDGHKSANFQPWVFKTTDFGETWKNIVGDLPQNEPVYVISEDVQNPRLLFLGTEIGAYFTIDDGAHWTRLNGSGDAQKLPTVAVNDIMVHPRDRDLIIGTHGRGLWIMDDISALQQLTPDVTKSEAYLFSNKIATQWINDEPMDGPGNYGFSGENPSKNAVINYWLGSGATGEAVIEISDAARTQTRRFTIPAQPGVGKLDWNMRFGGGGGRGPVQEAEEENRRGDVGEEAAGREAGSYEVEDDDVGDADMQEQDIDTSVTQNALGALPGGRGQGGRGGRGRGGRGGGQGGGGRGGRGGAVGALAQPGSYRVTLTVGGKTYVGSIAIRQDPKLNGVE